MTVSYTVFTMALKLALQEFHSIYALQYQLPPLPFEPFQYYNYIINSDLLKKGFLSYLRVHVCEVYRLREDTMPLKMEERSFNRIYKQTVLGIQQSKRKESGTKLATYENYLIQDTNYDNTRFLNKFKEEMLKIQACWVPYQVPNKPEIVLVQKMEKFQFPKYLLEQIAILTLDDNVQSKQQNGAYKNAQNSVK
ncbi:hypothetical protein SS50377_22864 [Spironucleus salmonicida]|uniref:Uncharacterized protein n=1 Tax=Spironucleus salmonicida TaxID=348837 RepID=V6LVX4_9EUKA|nr:hypothetical protein SS50377_22864 [Spironucleus salmonicida]|eukprot:EST48715.1 Hypothetical protein SS50377_11030 [Spironucleus salmonicida]